MSLFGTTYPPIDLDGAVVVISGGGRGIGRATAELFAARGALVCVGDLDEETAVDTAASIGARAAGTLWTSPHANPGMCSSPQ